MKYYKDIIRTACSLIMNYTHSYFKKPLVYYYLTDAIDLSFTPQNITNTASLKMSPKLYTENWYSNPDGSINQIPQIGFLLKLENVVRNINSTISATCDTELLMDVAKKIFGPQCNKLIGNKQLTIGDNSITLDLEHVYKTINKSLFMEDCVFIPISLYSVDDNVYVKFQLDGYLNRSLWTNIASTLVKSASKR